MTSELSEREKACLPWSARGKSPGKLGGSWEQALLAGRWGASLATEFALTTI